MCEKVGSAHPVCGVRAEPWARSGSDFGSAFGRGGRSVEKSVAPCKIVLNFAKKLGGNFYP